MVRCYQVQTVNFVGGQEVESTKGEDRCVQQVGVLHGGRLRMPAQGVLRGTQPTPTPSPSTQFPWLPWL